MAPFVYPDTGASIGSTRQRMREERERRKRLAWWYEVKAWFWRADAEKRVPLLDRLAAEYPEMRVRAR
jgi:hypothetical protein